jgi:hypothetical protein
MRTMSWSRYHTFTRIPTHLRRRAAKRMRHAAKVTLQKKARLQKAAVAARPEPERQSGDMAGGLLAGICQFLTQVFRTRRLRNHTDI